MFLAVGLLVCVSKTVISITEKPVLVKAHHRKILPEATYEYPFKRMLRTLIQMIVEGLVSKVNNSQYICEADNNPFNCKSYSRKCKCGCRSVNRNFY